MVRVSNASDSRIEMPHIVGECACYEFDDDKMEIYPCKFIVPTGIGEAMCCIKKKKFLSEGKLPKTCKDRQLERKPTHESED